MILPSIAKPRFYGNGILCLLLWLCLGFSALAQDFDRSGQNTYTDQLWQAIDRKDSTRLRNLVQTLPAPLAKFAYSQYLAAPDTPINFQELDNFLRQNPIWPGNNLLWQRAEISLPGDWPAEQTLAWFADREPKTWQGKVKLAQAFMALNQESIGKSWLVQAWRQDGMGPQEQNNFYARFRDKLTPADTRARLGMLIRQQSDTAARSLAKSLGKNFITLAEAQIAYRDNKRKAKQFYQKLPPALRSDPDLAILIMQQKRRAENYNVALQFLAFEPKQANPELHDLYWTERHILARQMLREKHFAKAYQLAAGHHLKSGVDFVDAEFLAGWIALRRLNQPEKAIPHFQKILADAVNPLAVARGNYWLGQSWFGRNPMLAQQFFSAASKFPTSFYGQLARSELGQNAGVYELPVPPAIPSKAKENFTAEELIQLCQILREHQQNDLAQSILLYRARNAKSSGEFLLLADYAERSQWPDIAVNIARQARMAGFDLIDAGYPLPNYALSTNDPEAALAYAIIRQESSFDPNAKSQAGALGLMQIMPATGRDFAKKLGWDFNPAWLVRRPEYNIRLGQEVLAGKLALFDNNYALGVAAYNAGPSRVQEWLRDFGDPRSGKIAMVDWIEMIPFGETRSYVQRVLENLVVYRYRLNSRPISSS